MRGLQIAVDPQGNGYVTGYTLSTNFPTPNQMVLSTTIHGPLHQPSSHSEPGGAYYSDAFVAKFSPSGALLYSTYLGGVNFDKGTSIAADSTGVANVVGVTGSGDFGPPT